MFYAAVHAMEAVLGKENIHSPNHQSRKAALEKLNISGLKDALNRYKILERKAHDSRYTDYKIYDWEVHRTYKELLKKIIIWFNGAQFGHTLQTESCDKMDEIWHHKYETKDAECYMCH